MAEDAGALLVRAGLIADEQLAKARRAREQRGGTVGEHLVMEGVLGDEVLADFLRTRLMVPQVTLRQLARIGKDIVNRIPADMAVEFRCLPVALDRDGSLTVAMADPSLPQAIEEISFFTSAYVVRAVATQSQIAWALAHYYGQLTPLGERLLEDPAGALIPGPMPPRGSLTRVAGAEEPPAPGAQRAITDRVEAERHHAMLPVMSPFRPESSQDEDAVNEKRPELPSIMIGSEALGGEGRGMVEKRAGEPADSHSDRTSGEFIVAPPKPPKPVAEPAVPEATPQVRDILETARLPSSPPVQIPGLQLRYEENSQDMPRASSEVGGQESSQDSAQESSLPLPAPEPASVEEDSIPMIIEEPDEMPPYRPPRGVPGRPQRVVSFFHDETAPTGPLQTVRPRPKTDPALIPRAGVMEVSSQPIQILQESLPAVLIAIQEGDDAYLSQRGHTDHVPLPLPTPAETDIERANTDPYSLVQSEEVAQRAQTDEPQYAATAEFAVATPQFPDAAPDAEVNGTSESSAQVRVADGIDAALEEPEESAPTEAVPETSAVPEPSSPMETTRTPAPIMDPPSEPIVAPTRASRRRRRRTFQGLGFQHEERASSPVPTPVDTTVPTSTPPAAAEHEPAAPMAAMPAGVPGVEPAAPAPASHEPAAPTPDGGQGWDELFSDGAPVRTPEMPTLRVAVPDTLPPPSLLMWPSTDSPALGGLADSIQKAAEAAAEAISLTPEDGEDGEDGKPGTTTDRTTGKMRRQPAVIVEDSSLDEDERWGPPGTTIPPPYLGAYSEDEVGNRGLVPLTTDEMDDGSGIRMVPLPDPDGPTPQAPLVRPAPDSNARSAVSGRHERAESVLQAPLSLYDSEHVTPQVLREFENSQESLAELLRRLQLAETRDAVIDVLIAHMSESHEHVAFFAVKSNRVEPWKIRGGVSRTGAPSSQVWLRLDISSTFQDIVDSRLPFRGEITDQVSRDFIAKTFGSVGPPMLGLPVTIRERVVGILYGDTNNKHVFVQNLGVLVRAAGGALERIIKRQKG